VLTFGVRHTKSGIGAWGRKSSAGTRSKRCGPWER
jgi:hypothetical protein